MRILSVSIFFLASVTGCATKPETESLGMVDEYMWQALGVTWSERAVEAHIGGYVVIGPGSDPNGDLMILKDGQGVVDIEGSDIVVLSNSKPVLTIQDRDNDGVFDFVSYTTTAKNNTPQIEVTDGDMDGQMDLKMTDDGQVFANISGDWHLLERRDDQPGVLVNGEWHSVAKVGWRWELTGQ